MDPAALLQELRDETLPQVPRARAALETARASQNPAEVAPVRELLHKVAGTAAPVGLPALSRLARFGEELAVLVLTGEARPGDGALTLLGRVLDAVDDELAGSGAPPPPSLAGGVPRPPPTPSTSRAMAPPPPVPELEKPQVLLVDGDVISTKLFTRFLKDRGFDLRGVKAPEALPTLELGFGDVLLLDLGGAAAASGALALLKEARARHVPVVIISKLPRDDAAVAALAAEADEFLAKPVAPEDLALRLKAQSERRRAVRSARARAPTGRVDALRPPAPHPAGAARAVLVVDDSRVIRGLVREFLGESKVEVVEADDGEAALALLAQFTGALAAAIVDMQMPGLDGLGLTRALRASARFAALPIVLLSAMDDAASQQSALDAGANAYLVKSRFDAAELRRSLRSTGVEISEP